jgi:hypothetical protein
MISRSRGFSISPAVRMSGTAVTSKAAPAAFWQCGHASDVVYLIL